MFYQPNFKYIFCDMDGMFSYSTYLSTEMCQDLIQFLFAQGTLLDSSGLVPETNAEAIRVARSRGVQTIIATGKVMLTLFYSGNLVIKEKFISCLNVN